MRNSKIMIIAEAGVNHNGSVKIAKELIDIAADAGADAVKFQTYTTENLLIKNTPKAKYQIINTQNNDSQYKMLKELELTYSEFITLFEHAQKKNIQFLSTPFDFESIDLLAYQLNIPYIKIASNEISNGPFLLAAAQTQKPIILSTGMSNLSDIEKALSVITFGYLNESEKPCELKFSEAYNSHQGQMILKEKVALLHCTTEYPTRYENVNLKAMQTLKSAFGLAVGYSDHTLGTEISIAAAALGAEIIEKHFTINTTWEGPDHKASLDPIQLKMLVTSIRHIERALGDGIKRPTQHEIETQEVMRRSLVANQPVKKGDSFNATNLTAKQPSTGVSPLRYWEYLEKVANKNYQKDEIIE